MPFLHRFPFWFSWSGFRGSHIVWALFETLKKLPASRKIQLPNKFPLIVNEKDWIAKTIYQGTYERSLLHFLDSLVLSGLVVDVGANIGVTLWHGLRHSHPTTKFIAFEPSKQCTTGLQMATSQMAREGHVLEYAIGDSDGTQLMHGIENEMHSGGASLISHSGLRGHSVEVEVRKLDTVLTEYFDGSPVSLLKIDTEGYESHVIGGAGKLLKSGIVEIIIMEVSPNFGDVYFLKYLKKLLGEGYLWFILEEKGKFRRRPSLRRISLDASLTLMEQWNLVLIRTDVFERYLSDGHPIFVECRD